MGAELTEIDRANAPGRRTRAIAFGATVLLAISSCHGEDFGSCHPEVATGEKFRVTLLEEWPQNSQYPYVATNVLVSEAGSPNCNYKADILPGTALDFQVVGSYERHDGGCDARVGTVVVAGISFDEPGTSGFGGEEMLVQSSSRVTLADGCTGGWAVGVVQPRGSAGRFAPAVAGQVPPLVVVRRFQATPDSTCPAGEKLSYCLLAATAEPL